MLLFLSLVFLLISSGLSPIEVHCSKKNYSDAQSIGDGNDLKCDFEGPCRWRNGRNGVDDETDWEVASEVILDSWHSIPRSKDGFGELSKIHFWKLKC